MAMTINEKNQLANQKKKIQALKQQLTHYTNRISAKEKRLNALQDRFREFEPHTERYLLLLDKLDEFYSKYRNFIIDNTATLNHPPRRKLIDAKMLMKDINILVYGHHYDMVYVDEIVDSFERLKEDTFDEELKTQVPQGEE